MSERVEVGGNCTLDQFIAALEAGAFLPGWVAREAEGRAYLTGLQAGAPIGLLLIPRLEQLEGRP